MPPLKNPTKKLNKENPIPIPKTQQKQRKPISINFPWIPPPKTQKSTGTLTGCICGHLGKFQPF